MRMQCSDTGYDGKPKREVPEHDESILLGKGIQRHLKGK